MNQVVDEWVDGGWVDVDEGMDGWVDEGMKLQD
jgi:hypothetical protein